MRFLNPDIENLVQAKLAVSKALNEMGVVVWRVVNSLSLGRLRRDRHDLHQSRHDLLEPRGL